MFTGCRCSAVGMQTLHLEVWWSGLQFHGAAWCGQSALRIWELVLPLRCSSPVTAHGLVTESISWVILAGQEELCAGRPVHTGKCLLLAELEV